MPNTDFQELITSGEYAPTESQHGLLIRCQLLELGLACDPTAIVVYEAADGRGWLYNPVGEHRPRYVIGLPDMDDPDSCIFYHPEDLRAWMASLTNWDFQPTICGGYIHGMYYEDKPEEVKHGSHQVGD